MKTIAKALFVTGTGTDVGKTYVTALIAKLLRGAGVDAGYYKAAVSGVSFDAGGRISSDATFVAETAGIDEYARPNGLAHLPGSGLAPSGGAARGRPRQHGTHTGGVRAGVRAPPAMSSWRAPAGSSARCATTRRRSYCWTTSSATSTCPCSWSPTRGSELSMPSLRRQHTWSERACTQRA